jgi:uncharacterized protein YyaL (SSP411 family)
MRFRILLLFFVVVLNGFAKLPVDNLMVSFEKQFRVALAEIKEKEATNTAASKMVPRTISTSGELVMVAPDDWTSGFFAGSLWYLYENTQNDFWKQKAIEFTDKLEKEQFNVYDHDIGFKMYCSYGNGLRLACEPKYKAILIQSANSLSKRFNPRIGCIKSWDFKKKNWQFPVIIDNMMNLELLFWATRETKDSSYYKIAVSHADKTLQYHFRHDFSCYHVVDYDTTTLKPRKRLTFQGFADESSWARGQAWALYGYAMMYRETHDVKYLNQTREVAKFIFNNKNMPSDLVPFWDYDDPKIPNAPKDASAAAIVASALFELSTLDKMNAIKYRNLASKILVSLEKNYRSLPGENRGFILLHSTGSLPFGLEIDVPLNYADYYYLEALTRQKGIRKSKK